MMSPEIQMLSVTVDDASDCSNTGDYSDTGSSKAPATPEAQAVKRKAPVTPLPKAVKSENAGSHIEPVHLGMRK